MLKPIVVTLALIAAAPAGAGWFDAIKGNDTGGIIPWDAPDYRGVAATHCGTYGKYALITSVARRYGDYTGFVCVFPRDYDPVKARGGWWWLRIF
jgi:hypothetical protein